MQKKKIVYPELEAQLAKKGCYKMKLAKILNITPRTLSNKLKGVSRFTAEEAIQIQEQWFNDISVNELFKKNEQK
ncbi:MAG: hypothetical protein K2H66_05600 [Oscillospiraceae bacterium]|nr:hypothetical protein [Oscillospiraceae bacterium]